MLTASDVAAHCNSDSLWMIISGQVYDLTEFASEHPGGKKVLLKWAGKDATEEYDPIHPKGTIESLSKSCHKGPVDMSTVQLVKEVVRDLGAAFVPTLTGCLNLRDFEIAAEILLKPKAWSYYASAADTEKTKIWNQEVYNLVRFRPRVLVNVEKADISTSILGHKSSSPFFISPAAMGRLAHPDGELCLARVAAEAGIPYCVSGNASVGFEELVIPTATSQTLFYQLYVNKDRSKTEDILRRVAKAGYKSVWVTVDAPVAGKRERDERTTMDSESASDGSMRASISAKQGIAQSLGSYVDASLTWNDLAWIKKAANGLPIVVKGIQTAEDAALCAKYGVSGFVCSNHGGRQLDGAPSSLEILEEIRLREPQVFKKCEVYVDGGIQRGTDVLKALCLGATAVGIGRPYMYSLVFGDEGVRAVTDILQAEISQNLRLLGADRLSKLNPSMVNTRLLDARLDLNYKSTSRFWKWSKL